MAGGGANPSAANVGNILTAQAILFDKELIPNLKGETDAFVDCAERRVQPLNAGTNRQFFQYDTLLGDTTQSGDGVIGAPEFVGQISSPAQIGEWNNYTNFSSFVIAATIDDVCGNSGVELGYQAGQSISELYSAVADSAGLATVDTQVNQSALLVTPFTLDLGTVRELKQQLVSKNVLPCKRGKFMGAVSPNVLGDIYNATTVNNSIVDLWKYANMDKFDKMAGSDQKMDIELPGTNIVFRQTPFVTTTANYAGSGKIAYRTYVFGNYAMIGVWLGVPGDTELGDGDWRTIDCKVVDSAPASSYDPTGTIGGWCSYKFHQTVTLPPARGANTQRLRFIDSVPAIQ
jgi:hypothetical protein